MTTPSSPDKALDYQITIRTDHGHLSVPAGSTLDIVVDQIVAGQNKTPACVATAVNGQFVARGARTGFVLDEGDTVMCFSPITGG
ncbi:MAG: MoaD/ThiS family protein [Aquabacterium sp.]